MILILRMPLQLTSNRTFENGGPTLSFVPGANHETPRWVSYLVSCLEIGGPNLSVVPGASHDTGAVLDLAFENVPNLSCNVCLLLTMPLQIASNSIMSARCRP